MHKEVFIFIGFNEIKSETMGRQAGKIGEIKCHKMSTKKELNHHF
jgi:hypothetical protein